MRLDQHIPSRIRRRHYENLQTLFNNPESAVAEYLIIKPDSFARDFFLVVIRAHSDYHLRAPDSMYIKSKESSHYKQKEWFLGLKVICP